MAKTENSMVKVAGGSGSFRDSGYKPSAPPRYTPPAPVKVPAPSKQDK